MILVSCTPSASILDRREKLGREVSQFPTPNEQVSIMQEIIKNFRLKLDPKKIPILPKDWLDRSMNLFDRTGTREVLMLEFLLDEKNGMSPIENTTRTAWQINKSVWPFHNYKFEPFPEWFRFDENCMKISDIGGCEPGGFRWGWYDPYGDVNPFMKSNSNKRVNYASYQNLIAPILFRNWFLSVKLGRSPQTVMAGFRVGGGSRIEKDSPLLHICDIDKRIKITTYMNCNISDTESFPTFYPLELE